MSNKQQNPANNLEADNLTISKTAAVLTQADYTTVAAQGLPVEAAYRLLTGVVVPRPIAWVCSKNRKGVVNVAPFSSFNYVAHSPPMVAININANDDGSLKDTASNLLETGEFVVNIPSAEHIDAVNESSFAYLPEQSEAEALGIPLLPGVQLDVPRIAWAQAQLECRLQQTVPLGEGVNVLYIGEVVAFHLSQAIFDGRRVDSQALNPLARLGGPFYASLGRLLSRDRPKG